ncbi:terpene synthase family protein [Belliella aquatica]|uniref:Terpene synthase n=1 Tax=Belliella aquatica TaxID=1323734 RepID=A0ABQ1LZX1_9BACT|nr:hypothetical protein [Belliella aquatica]MCH7406838.1 hypothetical protein [Belliella aquatica]GGC32298.1 hypothetical protein GCM10010993_09140 [Belliella aquatica]
MEKEKLMLDLKAKLDGLAVVNLEAYQKLMEFVEFKTFKKGDLIRKAGEQEHYSYYLFEGVLAFEKNERMVRLFFEDQVVFDLNAYQSGMPSQYSIVALKDSILSRLSHNAELEVLNKLPEFSALSQALQQKAKNADDLWVLISQKHYRDAYTLLNKYFKGFFRELTPSQLAQLFNLDKRTISRHNKYLHQIKEYPIAKVKMGEILNYDFFSALHLDARLITDKVIAWLKKVGLLANSNQIRKFRENKMTYLAARLYPEASPQKSIWIGKLYAWLFLMDDYTDKLPKGKKLNFWAIMGDEVGNIMDPYYQAPLVNENVFISAFEDLWKAFTNLNAEWYRAHFRNEMLAYLVNNLWEANNKDFDRIPPLEEYLAKRPYFSGGRIALELIPLCLGGEPEEVKWSWEKLEMLRKLAAELIFISNDILSYHKEAEINDCHNWIALLMEHQRLSKNEAMDKLLQRHDQLLHTFESKVKLFTENYKLEDALMLSMIKNIKFQISGTVTWSVEDTKRYLPDKEIVQEPARLKKLA